MIEKKNDYIRDLEGAVAERDRVLQEKEPQASEQKAAQQHRRGFLKRG
jgi:hypothetical protein